MANIFPKLVTPGVTQRGLSSQRTSGVFFIPVAELTGLGGVPPLVIPAGTTIASDIIVGVGFNTFMGMVEALGNTITFKITHVDPYTGTELNTRNILAVAAGSGLQPAPFGYGNAAALGGSDVFYSFKVKFTANAGAAATLQQFPGLWGAVR